MTITFNDFTKPQLNKVVKHHKLHIPKCHKMKKKDLINEIEKYLRCDEYGCVKSKYDNIQNIYHIKGYGFFSDVGDWFKKAYNTAKTTAKKVFTPALDNKIEKLDDSQKVAFYFSKQSYKPPNQRVGKYGYEYLPNYSNTYEAVFINHRQKIIYIAFRGTQLDGNDLNEDVQIIAQDLGKMKFTETSDRMRSGRNLINNLKSAYPSYEIRLTGHSLAGRIATELARETGYKTIAFNTGGLDLIGNLQDRINKRDNIQQITSGKDIISIGSLLNPNTKVLTRKDTGLNPLKNHSLDYFKPDEEDE